MLSVLSSGNPEDCIMQYTSGESGASAKCCPDGTTFYQDGVVTWRSPKVVLPCNSGMFPTSLSVVVPVGLSPGQILAVIAAFLMFALAIGLCLFGLRVRIIRVLRWCGSIFTVCIRRMRDIPCQDPVLQFCRYYQNRHAPIATPRSPPMISEFVFLDANELYVPSHLELDVGNEFLASLAQHIINKRAELSAALIRVDGLLHEGYAAEDMRCQDALLEDVAEEELGAVGGAPLDGGFGSDSTLTLQAMVSPQEDADWST